MNIWYPCHRAPKELHYNPWLIHASRGAAPAAGRFPLLVLSHETPGNRFSYHTLAAWLASCGFVVAAPTHARDCMDNMEQLFTWEQLSSRADDLSAAISYLLADRDMSPSIDARRVGLLGFGTGATVALLLGGAMPECSGWTEYCSSVAPGDIYCTAWARERINGMCANFPLPRNLADPRIRAVAAIAPGYGMIFDNTSFSHFFLPLLLVSAGRDTLNPPRQHSRRLADMLGPRCSHITLDDADTGTLMAACPPSVAEEMPELCEAGDETTRRKIQQRLREAVTDFFIHYLGNSPEASPDLTVAQ